MWHVGMDWHSRQTDLTVRDGNGRRQFHRHVRGGIDAVVAELRKIAEPFSVTFEASTGYGHVYDELAKVAHTVRVAHPGHLRLIFRSKRKCDRPEGPNTSKVRTFGHRLRPERPGAARQDMQDRLPRARSPQVHVPRHEVRAWRRMISHRNRMVGDRTATKCRIRAFLRSLGIVAPRSLWTKAGRTRLGPTLVGRSRARHRVASRRGVRRRARHPHACRARRTARLPGRAHQAGNEGRRSGSDKVRPGKPGARREGARSPGRATPHDDPRPGTVRTALRDLTIVRGRADRRGDRRVDRRHQALLERAKGGRLFRAHDVPRPERGRRALRPHHAGGGGGREASGRRGQVR